MDIVIRYFDGCPHWATARERLEEALLAEGLSAGIHLETVSSPEQAERVKFKGSPTILIDGRDPFPGEDGWGFTCRVYETEAGAEGSPSVAQIRGILSEAS